MLWRLGQAAECRERDPPAVAGQCRGRRGDESCRGGGGGAAHGSESGTAAKVETSLTARDLHRDRAAESRQRIADATHPDTGQRRTAAGSLEKQREQ